MHKVTVIISVIVLHMLFLAQLANANYTIHNGSIRKVHVIVSTWMEGDQDIPTGFRTRGYISIESGDFVTINSGSSDYYIRMLTMIDGFPILIEPSDAATRMSYEFKIDLQNDFTVVEKADGKMIYGSEEIQHLVTEDGFYKYKNGGTFNISGENLGADKLARVNSELKKEKQQLVEINRQLTTLTAAIYQFGSPGYTIFNGMDERVYFVVSTWMKSAGNIPAGNRTQGYYLIEPGDYTTFNLSSSDYYIGMFISVNGTKDFIRPSDYKTRKSYRFWVEPTNPFTIVEDSSNKLLYSSDGIENLTRSEGFYKHGNNGTFKILGPNIELAEKNFKLAEVKREIRLKLREISKLSGEPKIVHRTRQFFSQEVHALLILLGNDKHIRGSVEQNESHLKELLRQVSQHADVHITVMTSEDEITGNVTTMTLSDSDTSNIKVLPQGLIKAYQVREWFNNLSSGQHDTILVYYSGHGEMRGTEDKHVLRFDQQTSDEMLRSSLSALLAKKPGRLKMLITDTCSNRVGTPVMVAKNVIFASVRQRSKTYIKNLFLQHKGILDITAVTPGHYGWGSTDIGGYFTVGLLQSLTAESDKDEDRFLTWEEVFSSARVKTNGLFKQANFLSDDRLKMNRIRQKGQVPFSHSLPTRVK